MPTDIDSNVPAQPSDPQSRNPEDYSTQQLQDPSNSISSQKGRPFAGKRNLEGEYGAKEALDRAFGAAKEALPQVDSSYKSSGATTVFAAVGLLLATPILFLIITLVCGGLCFSYAWLATLFPNGGRGVSRLFGLLAIILDVAIVVIMTVVPLYGYQYLSKMLKNRNGKLAAILAGASAFLAAILLFVPIWNGITLAPTSIAIFFIPIRWVLIITGGLLVPLFVALVVWGSVSSQKFCEQSGVFLKRYRVVKLDFDFAENALELLKRGEYKAAASLPKAPGVKPKHFVELSLWWHDMASAAYLELTPKFRQKTSPTQERKKESKEIQEQWLAFSAQLDRNQAQAFALALEQLKDENENVRSSAADALGQALGGLDFGDPQLIEKVRQMEGRQANPASLAKAVPALAEST